MSVLNFIPVLTLCLVLFAIELRRSSNAVSVFQSSASQVVHRNLKKYRLETESSASYTSGYLRAEYKDTSLASDKFVQAVVDTIGLCYQFQQSAPKFQILAKATLDSENNRMMLHYSNYSNSHCNGVADSSSVTTQRIRYNVYTTHNVKLRVRTIWTPTLAVGLRIYPVNARGIQISYFGYERFCVGTPYRYRVATENCTNFPEFHGTVRCVEADKQLVFARYPFVPNSKQCAGDPTIFKVQPFACTNQGTLTEKSYEHSSCVITDIKRMPSPVNTKYVAAKKHTGLRE